ncbi:MAG: adenylate/guanylate cyclase domain-containing protein [Gaiellaceae bacterium]
MDAPEVRYAKSGDLSIAYSVVGSGPFDLVFVANWLLSSLEVAWDGPPARLFEALASFCRLIVFDKRGTGLSDGVAGVPDLETRMDDVRAVMDAAGSERAALMGVVDGGVMSSLFAATHPKRTSALVLFEASASFIRADDYPWAETPAEWTDGIERQRRTYATPQWFDDQIRRFLPSFADDEHVRRWWARYVRTSASPGAAIALLQMNRELDVRHVLPAIGVPTLVLHREHEGAPLAEARYVAERIPGAKLVLLPEGDYAFFSQPEPIVHEVERFLTGIWERGEWDEIDEDRVLASVLFTDIVGSTAKAAELGDARWRELLEQHHALIRRLLVRFRGRELDTAGDGFFASFDGPARAIRCACAIATNLRTLGIDVRAGIHTGECEVINGKVGGIAVHIGARVAREAQPGEVLVSGTVKDLVAGSGLRFEERGRTELKGVPGDWPLYAVLPE